MNTYRYKLVTIAVRRPQGFRQGVECKAVIFPLTPTSEMLQMEEVVQ